MPVTVRTATASESEAVADLAARTFALACPPHLGPADISAFVRERLSPERFRAHIEDAQRRVAVALGDDGDLVGYTMLVLHPPPVEIATQLTATPTAELSKIYVDPEHHGGGVAAELLSDAAAAVSAAGCTGVWLGTNEANVRAQRFYVKHGFGLVGTRRFQVGESWESDVIYERRL